MTGKHSAKQSLLPDTAISDPKMDRLDRTHFAESLATSIRNLKGNDSFVIGLCGPWGSGKTSVLNFVLADLESKDNDSTIILRFNPWWFSGREQLLETFLAQFMTTLSMSKPGEKAKQAGKLLATLSAALRPISLLPLVGEAAKVGKDAADAMAAFSTAYADAVGRDVASIRNEIDELLAESKYRIVVVMDDIDRLSASEIAQLFLILKAVADFPRTVYLLAFDESVVTQAISNHLGVEGRTYLEKIVQLQIDVPPTAHTAIQTMFLEQLSELVDGEVLTPQNLQYFFNMFHDGVKHFIATPRSAKKLTNMLRFSLPPLRGEVNVVDMIGIACLAAFAPCVITTIVTNADRFTGVGPRTNFGRQDEYQEHKEFHQRWLSELAVSDRAAVEGIVKRLFPSVNYALDGMGCSVEYEATCRSELKVCSTSHFEKYFRLAIPTGAISEQEWKRVESNFDNPVSLDETLTSFIGQSGRTGYQSRSSELLDRALHFAQTASSEKSEKLFKSVLRTGDRFLAANVEEIAGGLVPIDSRQRLDWLMQALLERLPTPKQRETVILDSFDGSCGIETISELTVRLGMQNGLYIENSGTSTPLVRKTFVRRLAKKVREKIQAAIDSVDGDRLKTHANFMRIVFNWWHLGGKKAAKDWLKQTTESDEKFVSALSQQVGKTRSAGTGDRIAMESPTISVEHLRNVLSLKACRKRCEELLKTPPEWLSDEERTVLTLAMNSIQPNGRPIDSWAKRIDNKLQDEER